MRQPTIKWVLFLLLCTRLSVAAGSMTCHSLNALADREPDQVPKYAAEKYPKTVENIRGFIAHHFNYQIEMTRNDKPTQRLLIAQPEPTNDNFKDHAEKVAPNTMAFIFTDGWYSNAPPISMTNVRPPFHAYVRIENEMYHLLDDGKIRKVPYVQVLRRMAQNPDRRTYEMVFPVSAQAKTDLKSYYEGRLNETATIDGKVMMPSYEVGGTARMENGKCDENCVSFALSFVLPHWGKDYPGINELVSEGGLTMPEADQQYGIARPYIEQLLANAKASSLIVWGADMQRTGDPTGYHHERMVDTLLGKGRRNLERKQDFTVRLLVPSPEGAPASQATQAVDSNLEIPTTHETRPDVIRTQPSIAP